MTRYLLTLLACCSSTGSCAISTELPLPQRVDTKSSVSPASNGMNAHFDQMFYCVAAEPHATL
eukprot:651921-Prymnesium_polylepis.1